MATCPLPWYTGPAQRLTGGTFPACALTQRRLCYVHHQTLTRDRKPRPPLRREHQNISQTVVFLYVVSAKEKGPGGGAAPGWGVQRAELAVVREVAMLWMGSAVIQGCLVPWETGWLKQLVNLLGCRDSPAFVV